MNNNTLQIVSFEQAQKLKKAGFDWPCFRYYNMDCCSLEDDADKYEYNWNTTCNTDVAKRLYEDEWVEVSVCSAPTVALALKFMRDKHNLACAVYASASGWSWGVIKGCHDATGGTFICGSGSDGPNDGGAWDTFEDCESAMLDKILKLIEEKPL